MPMTRQQLRHQSAIARYQADKQKPPTRKQAKAWLEPMRKALIELRTGEIDSYRGYAITRIHWSDNDFARVDHALNGFVALITRLAPEFNIKPFHRLAKKLEAGVLLTLEEVDACIARLSAIEDLLLTFKRCELVDAANTEMTFIELERLGFIKEAA